MHAARQHLDGAGAFDALVRTYSRKEPSELPGVCMYSLGDQVLLTDTAGCDGGRQTVSGLGQNRSGHVCAALVQGRTRSIARIRKVSQVLRITEKPDSVRYQEKPRLS